MDLSIINELSQTSDRFKLYVLKCNQQNLNDYISKIQDRSIPVINVGREIAQYIYTLESLQYLSIDVFYFTNNLLESHKNKINNKGNDVLAIYNLGILLEPKLKINAQKLLKEFSKYTSLIIIWENPLETSDKLIWPTQSLNYFYDFSDTKIKELQYAI